MSLEYNVMSQIMSRTNRERKFPGQFAPGNESSMERIGLGPINWPGSEKAVNRKSTTSFPMSLRWTVYVTSKPHKWGSKTLCSPITSRWLKIDLWGPENIIFQLYLAKTDPHSSRVVSLRQLRFLFMWALHIIIMWAYYYFMLPLRLATKGILFSGCPWERDHIPEVCEHDILKASYENFTKFTT